jgi:hypothetical protein
MLLPSFVGRPEQRPYLLIVQSFHVATRYACPLRSHLLTEFKPLWTFNQCEFPLTIMPSCAGTGNARHRHPNFHRQPMKTIFVGGGLFTHFQINYWRARRAFQMTVSMSTLRGAACPLKLSFTDAILRSVLKDKELCAFLFESSTAHYVAENPRQELLDFYGDDPDRLIHMWSWAKASKVFERNPGAMPAKTEQDESRKRSFRRQLKESGKIFNSSQNPFFDSLTSLKFHYNSNQMGGEFEKGLTDFLQATYHQTLSACVKEGLEALRLADEEL